MNTDLVRGYFEMSPEERLLEAIYEPELKAKREKAYAEFLAEVKKHKNKLNRSLIMQRRYARKRALPDDLTLEQYEETLSHFSYGCALTGQHNDIEQEHAIPLSIGHGGTTFGNCYPMASGLNQSKNNANIFEWFETNSQRFNLEQSRFDRLIEWLGKANGMTVEEYRDYVYWCHANPRSIDELKAN